MSCNSSLLFLFSLSEFIAHIIKLLGIEKAPLPLHMHHKFCMSVYVIAIKPSFDMRAFIAKCMEGTLKLGDHPSQLSLCCQTNELTIRIRLLIGLGLMQTMVKLWFGDFSKGGLLVTKALYDVLLWGNECSYLVHTISGLSSLKLSINQSRNC